MLELEYQNPQLSEFNQHFFQKPNCYGKYIWSQGEMYYKGRMITPSYYLVEKNFHMLYDCFSNNPTITVKGECLFIVIIEKKRDIVAFDFEAIYSKNRKTNKFTNLLKLKYENFYETRFYENTLYKHTFEKYLDQLIKDLINGVLK